MAENEAVFRFKGDSTSLVAEINKVKGEFDKLEASLKKAGLSSDVLSQAKADQFGFDQNLKKIALIQERVAKLQSMLNKGEFNKRIGPGFKEIPGTDVKGVDGRRTANVENLQAAINNHLEAGNRLIADGNQLNQTNLGFLQQTNNAYKERLGYAESYQSLLNARSFLDTKVDTNFEAGIGAQALGQRFAELQKMERQVIEAIAKMEADAMQQLPEGLRKKVMADMSKNSRDMEHAQKRYNAALEEEFKIRSRLASDRGLPDDPKRLLANADRLRDARIEMEKLKEARQKPLSQIDAAQDISGLKGPLEEAYQATRAISEEMVQLLSNSQQLVLPIKALQAQLDLVRKQMNDENTSAEQRVKLAEQAKQLIMEIRNEQQRLASPQSKGFGLPQKAEVDGLARLFAGAFDGIGRRFVATLQFALSGALLFGVQKFVRDFVKSAFEVERTFADISTAFEFDIDAERGTLEFERRITGIRRQTLALSEDLNVLPQQVNAAAYVMVARFSNATNAVRALRAQLLATKVSGIEQAEVLRSLTAVAESFAGQTERINYSLSQQERILQRENTAVEIYAKALDYATTIQQRFGIEVEDTLDGMARASETFAAMGFSMEQTAALVAAVSRQLGQTGAQSSEKLVRSLGQLTNPEIRNALLDIADLSESLFLTSSDFSSGSRAWSAISEQFQQFQNYDPTRAAQFIQVLGQRRETEVIAAALGTLDLQADIMDSLADSAGSAEDRFRILERTADETMKSIAAGVDELAQNFGELNLLKPISIALGLIDELIGRMNKVLTVAEDIKDGLNFSDRLPVGSIAQNAGVAAGTVAVGSVLITSITAAMREIRGRSTAEFGALGEMVGVFTRSVRAGLAWFLVPLRASEGSLWAFVRALRASAGQALANSFGGRGVGGALGSVGSGLLKFATNPLVLVAVAAAAIGKAVTETRVLAQTMEDLEVAMQGASRAAGNRVREEGLEGDAARLALLEEQARAVRAQAEVTASGITPTFMSRLNASPITSLLAPPGGVKETSLKEIWGNYFELVTESGRRGGWGAALGTAIGGLNPWSETAGQLVEGSGEYLAKELLQLSEDSARLMLEEVRKAPLPPIPPERRRGGGGRRGERRAEIEEFEQALAAAETQQDFDKLLITLGAWADKQADGMNSYMAGVEASVTNLQRILSTTSRLLDEGFDSPQERRALEASLDLSINNAAAWVANAEQRLASGEVLEAEFEADMERYRQALSDAVRQRFELVTDELQKRLANLDLSGTSVDQAARRLDIATALLKKAQSGARTNQTIIESAEREVFVAERDLARARADAITSRLRRSIGFAREIDTQIARYRKLSDALRRQLIDELRARGGSDFTSQLVSDIQDAERAARDLERDKAARLPVARIRLGGAILDPIRQAQAQLAGAAEILKQYSRGSLEYLEAQVAFAEAQAALAQAQLDKLVAFAEAAVGVRDSLGRLRVEMAVAIRTLELIAQLYGQSSAEYARGQARIDAARAGLVDANLQLEDIERRLGTDLSNSFEQAQLTLIEIARRLQLDDLGLLERAQTELELAQAELDALGAFFDDRLFQLEFESVSGNLDTAAYVAALRRLLEEVDTSTTQGKEIFIQITQMIEGMVDDVGEMRFNIPDNIRLPTLFEVRRAVEADQLGVNYQDNRNQTISINVAGLSDMDELLRIVVSAMGDKLTSSATRQAAGGNRMFLGSI